MSEWARVAARESARQDELERRWAEQDRESAELIDADSAVCHHLGGMHLSSAHARPVIGAARNGDDVHAVAEVLRRELFIEQRLLQAAIDTVRAVRGEP